jgi:hypothetical protein
VPRENGAETEKNAMNPNEIVQFLRSLRQRKTCHELAVPVIMPTRQFHLVQRETGLGIDGKLIAVNPADPPVVHH